MQVITDTLHISTRSTSDIIDITATIEDRLKQHKFKDGIVTVFVVGSTACITTTEYEPGLKKDLPAMLEHLAPSDKRYYHDDTWGDGNGFSHVRASFIGPSLTIPVCNGSLQLGTWQQVILIECDTRGRNRRVILQMIGTTQ